MKTKILKQVLTRLAGRGIISRMVARMALLGSVALVAAALYAVPARAADSTCYDITGSGQQVWYSEAANSGVVSFDDPYQPVTANKGCARDTVGPSLALEGWVWNTNLGWISLYCPGGASAQNQGIDCGTQPYGVMVDQSTGVLSGYAWGENTGWISFNCLNDAIGCGATNLHKVVAETDPDCIGTIYSTTTYATPPSCPTHTEYDAFAWSDSVGWLDLSGVVIPFPPTLMSINPSAGKLAGGDTIGILGGNFAEPTYYKAVTVDNTGGSALTGYQISFTLDTAVLITAGKMRSDCSDLRVFDTDQSTSLPHWIVDGTCNSSTTKVWTKIDVGADTTKTVYASYNGLTGTQSPEGVFDFFDNFEGTNLDTAIWGGDTDQFSVSGGVLTNDGTSLRRLSSLQSFTGDAILEVKNITPTGGTPATGYQVGGFYESGTNSIGYLQHATQDYYRANSAWVGLGTVLPENVQTIFKYEAHGTTVDISAKDVTGATTYDSQTVSGNGLSNENIALGLRYFDGPYDEAYDAAWDWIFVRQYAADPPAVTTGSETSSAVTVDFGANAGTSLSRTNSSNLTVLVPASTTGAGGVVVTITNPNGQAITLSDGYTYYGAPTVTLVAPDSGTIAGGTNVTITGTGFYGEYSSPVTISNTGSALTDYQVPVTLNTAALVTAGKMRSDCADVRVYDTDGTTGIPFWVKDGTCNTANTEIWVKVPTVAAAGDTVISLVYGNSSLADMSNGNDVFEFFDDFADGSIDASKWANTSATETGGYAYASTDNNGWKGIISRQLFGPGSILENKIKFTGDMGTQGTGVFGFWQSWTTGQRTTFDEGCTEEIMCVRQTDSVDTESASVGENISGDWNLARIVWTDAGTDYYALRSDAFSFTDTLSVYNPNVGLSVMYGAQDLLAGTPVQMWVYWTYVRQYAATEPTVDVGTATATLPSVVFDTLPATSVVVVSSTSITAKTPAHAIGLVDVTVTNPDTQYGALTDGYEYIYDAPTVTNVNPGSGPATGETAVTITGTGFFGTPTVTFDGDACTDIVVLNDTTITCNTPAHADGYVDVVVTTAMGPGTLTNGYQYYGAVTVLSVDPVQGPTTGATDVTITGTNFFGTPTVTFGGVAATDVVVVNSSTITAKTPVHVSGLVDVVVTTSEGIGTLTDGFRYTCAVGAGEQCVEASISGGITFTVPSDFSFPPMDASNVEQESFSYDATGYTINVSSLLSVSDSRNNGGFQVQVQASTPFETAGGANQIPLENFYMATTSSDTGGYRLPVDDGIEYNATPVYACDGASLNVTPPDPDDRGLIPTILTTPSSFTQAVGLSGDPDTFNNLNLMNCDLTTGGRTGTFKQNVNYRLHVPGGQPGGTYNITLMYDLVT